MRQMETQCCILSFPADKRKQSSVEKHLPHLLIMTEFLWGEGDSNLYIFLQCVTTAHICLDLGKRRKSRKGWKPKAVPGAEGLSSLKTWKPRHQRKYSGWNTVLRQMNSVWNISGSTASPTVRQSEAAASEQQVRSRGEVLGEQHCVC